MDYAGLYGSSMGFARETEVAEASGPAIAGRAAAYWWVFIIAMLVGARMLYEWAE